VTELKFDAQGLLSAVVQDRLTGEVRMVAWMNREAFEATRSTGLATFYSRSREALWVKGESSGNVLRVRELRVDCDGDTLLVLVDPEGPSCHTGRQNCFFEPIEAPLGVSPPPPAPSTGTEGPAADAVPFLWHLEAEIAQRARSTAERSYTRSLLDRGVSKINEKLQEEAAELAQALATEDSTRVASEAADVVYHLLVGLYARGVSLRSVVATLAARAGQSGHAEKAARAPKP
jgi:phosphoribosyl-AMP cyclohydrolase / phosphoribosyl-ATP pyrophosphohydrolase